MQLFAEKCCDGKKSIMGRVSTSTLIILVLVVILILIHSNLCADACHRGYFLHTSIRGDDNCLPCSGGTFMPEDNHTQRACHECSYVEEPFLEYVASECNATHDAVIRCEEGYYRAPPLAPDMKGKCNKCTECDHPVYKCQGNQDTVCCPSEGYGVGIDTNGNPVCTKRCLQGEYLETKSSKCLPCPEETFLTALEHTSTQCNACPKPTSDLEIVLLPCTRKEPTLLGCVKGYYRQQAENSVEDICVRCTDCGDEGGDNRYTCRQCDYFRDTVCCSKPDMAVVDTPEGFSCTPRASETSDDSGTCGVDQYLYVNRNGDFRTCLPCPADTYMDFISHNNSSCKKCADFSNSQDYSTCQIKLELPDTQQHYLDTALVTLLSICNLLILVLIVISCRQAKCTVKKMFSNHHSKSKDKEIDSEEYEQKLPITEPEQHRNKFV